MIVKDTVGEFERPATGMISAVCANVFDLGMVPGFQGVITHKAVIMWELDQRLTKGEYAGKRFTMCKSYTASLNEKSNLRKDLESWRGKPFTAEELNGFDLDKVKGIMCLLNLIEKPKAAGGTSIVVASVNPPMKGAVSMTVETPADYVPKWIREILEPGSTTPQVADGDPIPF
jgi:hypothetical protein